MNNNEESTSIKKRRKRSLTPSHSPSSSRPSRSKSISKKKKEKKSKKSKKKDHHRSKKRSKSKKKSQKKTKSPKSPKSESSHSRSNSRQNYKNIDMNSHMMYPYPPFRMMPNSSYRPPYFPPPFIPGTEKIRPPIPIPSQNMKSIPQHNMPEMNPMIVDAHPPDKIVKDQNFLNSDEKLFESIVNSEMSIRNLYEDVQVSETYASSILYKTIKKLVNEPNTIIFEENKETKKDSKGDSKDGKKDKTVETGEESPKIKNGEILRYVFEDFMFQRSEEKMCINFGDMSDIRKQILNSITSTRTNNS